MKSYNKKTIKTTFIIGIASALKVFLSNCSKTTSSVGCGRFGCVLSPYYLREGPSPPERLNDTQDGNNLSDHTVWMDKYGRTTTKVRIRTARERVSFTERCNYLAKYCMEAYITGSLCARTMTFTYMTFDDYCMMDYVNCIERHVVWQLVHMGKCFRLTPMDGDASEVEHYQNDSFMEQPYVEELDDT